MTVCADSRNKRLIIPYQELLGNYDCFGVVQHSLHIIPYQELLGNYDLIKSKGYNKKIIPYQELLGNYDACPGRARLH